MTSPTPAATTSRSEKAHRAVALGRVVGRALGQAPRVAQLLELYFDGRRLAWDADGEAWEARMTALAWSQGVSGRSPTALDELCREARDDAMSLHLYGAALREWTRTRREPLRLPLTVEGSDVEDVADVPLDAALRAAIASVALTAGIEDGTCGHPARPLRSMWAGLLRLAKTLLR